MKKCIFPGTFDPVTKGHVDIAKKMLNYFDEVVFLFLENPKKNTMFQISDRVNFAKKVFAGEKNIKIDVFDGLMIEYCKKHGIYTVIRGVRNSTDFNYELLYNFANLSMDSKIQMLFIPTDTKYLHISSSLIREVLNGKGDISPFVPECILSDIKKIFY